MIKENHGANDEIRLSLTSGIATVTLNRPTKRNAVHLHMWRRLGETFQRLSENASVRAVILVGEGSHFCSGADISEFESVRSDARSGSVYEEATEAATVAIRDFPMPTIAAVSGYGVGGGCGLALACDFRVGDPSTKMGIPAARLGLVYSSLDCRLLYRAVGLASAKRVLFSGRHFSANECLGMGLLDSLHEGDAYAGARELANEFVANAPLSLKGSKVVVEAIDAHQLEEREEGILALIAQAIESADYKEGARAFVEKRPPVFVGR